MLDINKMSQQTYEQKFKTGLLQFLDELIEQYPTYPSIVIVRIFIKDKERYKILKFLSKKK